MLNNDAHSQITNCPPRVRCTPDNNVRRLHSFHPSDQKMMHPTVDIYSRKIKGQRPAVPVTMSVAIITEYRAKAPAPTPLRIEPT